MLPRSIDRARQGLARAEASIEAAATDLARSPFITPAEVSADRGDIVRLSARPGHGDPIGAVISLGEGARLYRANLHVIAAADEELARTLDLFA